MKYILPDIRTAQVQGKTVFVRADLDVPLTEFKVADDTRLKACLPTIKYLLQNSTKVIIAGKLGRPNGKVVQELSLELVAFWLCQKFKVKSSKLKVQKIGEFDGWKIDDKLFLLENLRFYPGEESNEEEFAKKLASLSDIYVNEAFAMCHRNNASVVAVTNFLPSFAGIHLQEEVKVLSQVFDNPKRPLVLVIGGKKVETKLPFVLRLDNISDYVLVGGKIAKDREAFSKLQHTMVADLTANGLDITYQSVEKFLDIIKKAKTIVWNGPMGLISEKFSPRGEAGKVESSKLDTERGTRELVEGIIKSGAYTIAGGGDTIEFLNKTNMLDKFDFVSTGGGAMLALLSGEELPGLKALSRDR